MPSGRNAETRPKRSDRPGTTSSSTPEALLELSERDEIVRHMIQEQLPLTRETYLDLAFPPEGSSLDSDEGLDAELETGLPQEFQLAYQDKPWSMVRSGNPDEEA